MKKDIWTEKIRINRLSLWDENARFPEEYFNKSEKNLIDYFLKKKDFKIESLAQEIVEEFGLPQLEKLVVLRLKGRNIVLEGNRRLVVYKLLLDQTITNNTETTLFFKELLKKIEINKSFSLECVVTTNKESGLKYIDRKHIKRNNEVGWGEQERHNYKVRRGNANAKTEVFRYGLGKLVRRSDIPNEMKEIILGKGFVTTFYRLMDSEAASEILGFEKKDDGTIKIKNEKDFGNKLKVIIFDLITKRIIDGEKLDSRSLNIKEQRENYLKSIGGKDKKRVEQEIKKNTRIDIFGNEVIKFEDSKKIPIYTAKIKTYQSLVDPSLMLPGVGSDKIKEVFDELQRINLELFPTATALLLRTLMEISVAEFADKRGIKIDNSGYFRTDSGKTKETLKEKIDYISTMYAPNDVKEAVKIFNGNSIFTETLNKISHNRYIFSSKDSIKTLWKNSKCFWEFLVSEIMRIEKNRG